MTTQRVDLAHHPASSSCRVLSVHNALGPTNIPLEAFVAIDSPAVERHVVSLTQSMADCHGIADSLNGSIINPSKTNPPAIDIVGLGCTGRRPWRYALVPRYLRTLSPDIVHVHHAQSAWIFASLARRLTNARIVTTIHRDFRTLSSRQKWLVRRAMAASDVILCNSRATRESLPAEVPTDRVRVVYNGVNLSELDRPTQRRSYRSCAENVLHIGTVGRLIPIKGIATIIPAVARIRALGQQIKLTIVGDGPERARLTNLVDQHGLRDVVCFAGNVSREQVYQHLAQFDVFVASSFSEGFCNAMVEAMYARCTVVATDIPVFREILPIGHPWFFTAGHVDHLVQTLRRIAEQPTRARESLEPARQRVERDLSLAACARNHIELYRSLSETPHRTGAPPIDRRHAEMTK
ncbi:MAG: glycosyltransferase family 4 protein [Planctomycetales bacterium]|nr:glycosyltransferase family 4 protein [Planctomycetales bacterium]